MKQQLLAAQQTLTTMQQAQTPAQQGIPQVQTVPGSSLNPNANWNGAMPASGLPSGGTGMTPQQVQQQAVTQQQTIQPTQQAYVPPQQAQQPLLPPFQAATQGLIAAAPANNAIGQQAAALSADYGAKIADVGQQAAKGEAAYATTGTSPVGEGNSAVIAHTAAAQQSALAAGQSAALQGTAQQLTGQAQAQSALASAGGLTKPEFNSYGLTGYDPATGQPIGGGSNSALNPLSNIQSIAQQVVSGQISPSQANAMGGNVTNFSGALNQAILGINPQYNSATTQAAFDSKQSNATTAGTAATNAYASTYNANYAPYVALKQNVDNVEQLGRLAVTVGTQGNINPLAPQFGNLAINQFRSQLSSADQVRFNSAVVAFAGAASQLLTGSSGQTPTGVTDAINGIISGNVPMSTLKALVDQAVKEGNIKLANAAAAVNTPGSQIGAPQVAVPAPQVDIESLRAQYGY